MHSILVIGCGSIGERHLRCFAKTGRCSVSACDTRPALLAAVEERYSAPGFPSLQAALGESRFDAAVVCTPAPWHLPIALELLAAGLHLLIEKPLAVEAKLVPEARAAMAQARRFVAVAYVYHLMPWISAARELLIRGDLGKVLHASVVGGQNFPSFRPAYREIYYASRDQGGGAVQDALTHLVNAVEWLIGPCTRVFCDIAHQALEGVTVEDTVTVSARHGDALVAYSLNQFQAPNETVILIHCERGSLKIESHLQRWAVQRHGDAAWSWQLAMPAERDDLFVAQANAFIDGLEGKPTPLCTFEEAVQSLKFNEAALRSAETNLPVGIV